MIWALEAAERFGCPSCSECSEAQRRRYGCGKDKAGVVGEAPFRSTSLRLLRQGKPDEIRECPVGLVLREAPYLYNAINATTHVENGASDPTKVPVWLQEIMKVASAERFRLHDLERATKTRGTSDAEYARQVVSRG